MRQVLLTPIEMPMALSDRFRRFTVLVCIFLMLAISAPLSACDWACESPVESAGCTDEPGHGDQPLDEECCASGCQDCFLQCCNSLVTLVESAITAGTDLSVRGSICTPTGVSTSAHTRTIDHPPSL